jgi:hypothetical protein
MCHEETSASLAPITAREMLKRNESFLILSFDLIVIGIVQVASRSYVSGR